MPFATVHSPYRETHRRLINGITSTTTSQNNMGGESEGAQTLENLTASLLHTDRFRQSKWQNISEDKRQRHETAKSNENIHHKTTKEKDKMVLEGRTQPSLRCRLLLCKDEEGGRWTSGRVGGHGSYICPILAGWVHRAGGLQLSGEVFSATTTPKVMRGYRVLQ